MNETIPKEFSDILGGNCRRYPMYNPLDMALCFNGEEEIAIPILDDVRIASVL